MAKRQRTEEGARRPGSLLAVALLLAPLALAFLAAPAQASRTIDYGLFGGSPVQVLELSLAAAAPPGATLELPLNASAQILEVDLELFPSPAFASTVLKGWGTPERNREDFGQPMDGGGDYNNDGYADLIVGAPMRNTPDSPGRVDAFYGRPTGLRTVPDWQYIGPSGIQFGGALAHADFNGDNYDDLLVGEQNWGYQGTPPEQAFVFYGGPTGLASTPGLVLESDNPTVETGYANGLAAGDLNGDGYGDLAIAELMQNGSPYQGRLWLHWGGPAGPSASNFTFAYPPGPDFHEYGFPSISLGDADGDGRDEIMIAKNLFHDRWGGIVIVEGLPGSTETQVVWDYNGSMYAQVGEGFAGGADITGDGHPDIVGGLTFPNGLRGELHVLPGLANGSYGVAGAFTLNGTIEGEGFGESSLMGDVDGDGRADLLVGAAHSASDAEGEAYLFTGGSVADGEGSAFRGGTAGLGEGFGVGAQYLGDVNGDGYGDFAFACAYGGNQSFTPGTVQVFYGNGHPFAENGSVRVGNLTVWSQAGRLQKPASLRAFGPAVQSYLENHTADADASGIVRVPLTLSFESGGRLTVGRIYVRYTVVLEPENFQAVSDPSGDAIVLSWKVRQPRSDGDVIAVWSNKSGDWATIANVSAVRGSFVDLDVVQGRNYSYFIDEVDPLTLIHSAPTGFATVQALDTKPPEAPSLQAPTINITLRSATLRWSQNTDDTESYEVWRRDGDTGAFALLRTLGRATLAYSDAGLPELTNLTWKVRAVDEVGLPSAFSEAVTAKIPDLIPPPTPQNLRAQPLPSGTAIRLAWDANAYDTVAYAVAVSAPGSTTVFFPWSVTLGTSATVTGLLRASTFYFRVEAIDAAGNRSAYAQVSAVTVDIQDPTAPAITNGWALPDGEAVRLEWEAFDDDIAAFEISWLQGGVPGLKANIDGDLRTADLTGLVNDLPVEVKVTAVDWNDYRGAPSAPLTLVPHDAIAPGRPTQLVAASELEGHAIRLTWAAPADADVAGYKIYFQPEDRSAPLRLAGAAGGSATQFVHTGIANLVVYSYEVAAVDEVANEGPLSSAAKGAAHDTTPPSVPALDPLPAATRSSTLLVGGRADPGVDVEVEVNGVGGTFATADAAGQFQLSVPLRQSGGGQNTLRVRAQDRDASVDAVARFSEYSEPAQVVLDLTPPAVLSSNPAAGGSVAEARPALVLRLDGAVKPGTVRASLRTSEGEETPVEVEYDPRAGTITVTPLADLRPGSTYALEVQALDDAGNALSGGSLTFKAAAGPAGDAPLFIASAGVILAAGVGVALRRRSAKASNSK